MSIPRIDAIEPPSWWLGSTLPVLRLLLRGENLGGARWSASTPDVRLGKPNVSPNGHWCFLDLTIAPRAKAGVCTLRATNPNGTATVRFEVLPAPVPRTRPLQANDVLTLLLPDRFQDGDSTNNRPDGAEAVYDPKRPRHFHGGDIAGIRKRLPYLRSLGVTAIWTTPIVANSPSAHPTLVYNGEPAIDYHGYGAVDGYRVSPHFGTLADLRALVSDARKLGMALLQDQVANHVGPTHRWVADPPTPTWIHPRGPNAFRPSDLFSPHSSPAARKRTLDGWFADLLPDLNQDDPECSRWLIQNALWWVGVAGFGGIRQDTVPYVPKSFWNRWATALRREFPGISLLGEVLQYEPAMVSHWLEGGAGTRKADTGFDQGFDFPLQGALRHVFAESGPLSALSETLARDPLYPDAGRLATFVGLHDTPRFASLAPPWALPLAFTFLFLSRGIPLVYYGDEIAMQGKDDPETRAHFPGGFPGDPRDAFERSGRTSSEQALHATISWLAELRRSHPALQPHCRTLFAWSDSERLAWIRHRSGASPQSERSLLCVIHRDPTSEVANLDGMGQVRLPRRSAGIWERRGGVWKPIAFVDGNGVRRV